MKNKPAYPITSVDNALRLSHQLILQDSLSVSEAADSVGVARSTAHRLLAMLIHHGFAEQNEDRRYTAGPMLRSGNSGATAIGVLRQACLPTMQTLVEQVRETATLQVLTGSKVRVIGTIECDQTLRIGSRTNRLLEAHQASGGKALLALLPEEEIRDRYASWSEPELQQFLQELEQVRDLGYAANDQESEVGVTAVGRAVPNTDANSTAAVTIAIPSLRIGKHGIDPFLEPLREAVEEIGARLAAPAR